MRRTTGLLILMTCLLGGLAGCSDDDPTDPVDAGIISTPEELMTEFRTAYEALDLAGFQALLHEDFEFVLQQDTVDEYGLSVSEFNYAEELSIHSNIFDGSPVVTPYGSVPGVSSIAMTTLDPQSAWSQSESNDPYFPDAWQATYNVRLDFARAGASTLIVSGFVKFYAINTGTGEANYRLLGAVDLTNGKSTESISWGDVQALYR